MHTNPFTFLRFMQKWKLYKQLLKGNTETFFTLTISVLRTRTLSDVNTIPSKLSAKSMSKTGIQRAGIKTFSVFYL